MLILLLLGHAPLLMLLTLALALYLTVIELRQLEPDRISSGGAGGSCSSS